MQRINGQDSPHNKYFLLAANAAMRATCAKARCGSVILSTHKKVIGIGYNSPPLNDKHYQTCTADWNYSKKPKYDLTCCIHAEWRAILDACKNHPDMIDGSTLYFMRIGSHGEFTNSAEPYCTVCSRLALESGISNFALWNNSGTDMYNTAEYNLLSYQYFKD